MIAFIGRQRGKGGQIYTMTDNGTNLRCLTDFTVSAWLSDVFWAPDGQSLAFTFKAQIQSPSYQVCTIAIDSKTVRSLTDPQQFSYGLQWLSNDLIVYREHVFPQAKHQHPTVDQYLCAMHSDGSQQQRLFDHRNYDSLTFSPDGTRLAMVSSSDHQLSIAGADGSAPVAIDSTGLTIRRVKWAANNALLAFVALGSKSRSLVYEDLYVVSLDGVKPQRVGRILARDRGGNFNLSPDNLYVAAFGSRGSNGVASINIIDMRTLKSRKIASVEPNPERDGLPGYPMWSQDGQSIFYQTFAHPYVHIHRADTTSGDAELLVGDAGETFHIQSWSLH